MGAVAWLILSEFQGEILCGAVLLCFPVFCGSFAVHNQRQALQRMSGEQQRVWRAGPQFP